jgi:formylglycine-generating enzyme required for sulfatase activity
LFLTVFPALAAPPVVSNVRAAQRPGTHLVDILYNVTDPDGATPLTISVAISDNGGTTYNVPVFTLSGAVGAGVLPGNDRLITWNAGQDWPGRFNNQCRVRILADDGSAPPAPANMAYIPGGVFQMGDNFGENTSAMPVHSVYISPFFMDKFEVNRELWLEVYTWSLGNGYGFNNSGSFKAAGHPVHSISWWDAVKWCNARSEKEGLTPCYYTDASQTTVYRSGNLNITNACVKWNANGYRLPTEAEWEKAARGTFTGNRFPWGNTITHALANYYAQPGSPSYDISTTSGYHPTYYTGSQPYTSPVGSFVANGYGLHDMSGNVWEWCWDWWDNNFYGKTEANVDDPKGPSVAQSNRLLRGGAWNSGAYLAQCSARSVSTPGYADSSIGFRCVRGL